ncbi:MAG: hypothetical protein K2Y23_05345 [Cyanobacteria bacterium]|nr:hypothetical protein [Cyanobacteriota bacterium]
MARAAGAGRAITATAIVPMLIVVTLFAVRYPRYDVETAGAGSDDDDAHNVGVTAVLAGESPYDRQTYLGNALHQLPGSYVIAAPFVLIGTSALQNLVCLPLFFVSIRSRSRDPRTAPVLAWLVVLLSPAVLHHVVTGSSYSWNAIWVLLGISWIWQRPRSLAAALFCGVAMCSRPNFLLLLAPLYAAMARTHPRHFAVRAVGLASVTAATLALPFYFASTSFGPLEGFGVLNQFDDVIPGAGLILLAVTTIAAVALSRTPVDFEGLMLQCAAIQAIPVVAVMLIAAAVDGIDRTFELSAYAAFASWFVVRGVVPTIDRAISSPASPRQSGSPSTAG